MGFPTFVKVSICLLSGWLESCKFDGNKSSETKEVRRNRTLILAIVCQTFFYLKGFSLDYEEISCCSQDGEKLSGLYTQINIYQQRKAVFAKIMKNSSASVRSQRDGGGEEAYSVGGGRARARLVAKSERVRARRA